MLKVNDYGGNHQPIRMLLNCIEGCRGSQMGFGGMQSHAEEYRGGVELEFHRVYDGIPGGAEG